MFMVSGWWSLERVARKPGALKKTVRAMEKALELGDQMVGPPERRGDIHFCLRVLFSQLGKNRV